LINRELEAKHAIAIKRVTDLESEINILKGEN